MRSGCSRMAESRTGETYLVTAVYEHSGRQVLGEAVVDAPSADQAVHAASEEINFPADADVQVEEVDQDA